MVGGPVGDGVDLGVVGKKWRPDRHQFPGSEVDLVVRDVGEVSEVGGIVGAKSFDNAAISVRGFWEVAPVVVAGRVDIFVGGGDEAFLGPEFDRSFRLGDWLGLSGVEVPAGAGVGAGPVVGALVDGTGVNEPDIAVVVGDDCPERERSQVSMDVDGFIDGLAGEQVERHLEIAGGGVVESGPPNAGFFAAACIAGDGAVVIVVEDPGFGVAAADIDGFGSTFEVAPFAVGEETARSAAFDEDIDVVGVTVRVAPADVGGAAHRQPGNAGEAHALVVRAGPVLLVGGVHQRGELSDFEVHFTHEESTVAGRSVGGDGEGVGAAAGGRGEQPDEVGDAHVGEGVEVEAVGGIAQQDVEQFGVGLVGGELHDGELSGLLHGGEAEEADHSVKQEDVGGCLAGGFEAEGAQQDRHRSEWECGVEALAVSMEDVACVVAGGIELFIDVAVQVEQSDGTVDGACEGFIAQQGHHVAGSGSFCERDLCEAVSGVEVTPSVRAVEDISGVDGWVTVGIARIRD